MFYSLALPTNLKSIGPVLMRKVRILAYTCLMVLSVLPFFGAQFAPVSSYASSFLNDSVPPLNTDTTQRKDSLSSDSLIRDTVPKKNALEAIVDYKSTDSIVMTRDKWAFLYGDAQIDYTDIKLTGEIVSMNMDSSIVEAKYGLDSIGEEFGYPIFTDKGTDYETKTMKYNFKTKKGYSQHLVTEQGEGYVVAGKARKNEDNSFFMREGMYTTCDQHDHPHFYLALTKAKVQPKKNVVTGPAYLVIEGLHIPFVGLPFGFFPFSESYSSGVIMPSYGDEMDKGFNLREGGYYFAINDYVDLKLLGTIYTKGSWGLSAQSTYRKRYKFSGNVNIAYQVTKIGDKELPDYVESKDFRIDWNHTQDPKANMFQTFSASVNFATQSYDRNNETYRYGGASTSNTKGSSVSFTQRFPNSPWSLSATMNLNQRSEDKTISATLPNVTISMSRVYPFKRKEAVGSEKWFEKIQLSYTGDFRNSIQTKEDDLSLGLRNWNTAMKHTIPVSATFSLFNYINVTPSFQYTERWYTKRQKQRMVGGSSVLLPKENKLSRVFDFNANVSFQTKLYGMYKPLFAKNVQIRHVFTPSITFSYAPDFSDPMWGYYDNYYDYETNGELIKKVYSPYSSEMFGTAPNQATGTINFSFQNNLEMKLASESDSTGYKKISLIDNLGIDFGYNSQAREFKWSEQVRMNLRLKLSKSLTVNLNAAFDPYTYEYKDESMPLEQRQLKKVPKLRITQPGKGFLRLMSTSYSISPSINQDTFNKWFGKEEKAKESSSTESDDGTSEEADSGSGRLLGGGKASDGEYDRDGYLKNQIRWNLGFSFGMSYVYDNTRIDHKKREYKHKLMKTLSFNGSIQPTKNWNISFNASYDFDQKKIPILNCSITRDLHCWSISGSFTPVGMWKSYYVTLRANSSLLQDLKHEFKGSSSSYDPNWD